MTLIKASLLFIVFLFIFYRMGLLLNKIFKSYNYLNILLNGFILTVAILQIIYIPMILLHVSFKFVLYTTIIILSILLIVSFFTYKISEEKRLLKYNLSKIKKSKKIYYVLILITIIGLQAVTSSLLFNENADDSFYVSLVEENQNSSSIYTKAPSLGIENTTFLSRYMISGHELALSVESKVFNIPSTILCHTIIPFIMILFSYMAYYTLARTFLNRRKSQTFVLLLSILFLFSGFSTRLRGNILLWRMWQGKEIFLNIVLTLILSNLISLNKYNQKRKIIFLTILNFSAIFFTNTAIFLVFFAYMPFGILQLLKKRWKTFGLLLLSGIPIVLYGAIYLAIAQNIQGSGFTDIKMIEILKNYIGTGYYHILYIISIIIIAIKGDKKARIYFLGIPIIYLVTIYNPMLTKLITKYFTGSEVFWRLLWLLPVEASIIYSFIILLYLNNRKIYKGIIFTIEVMLLICMGKFAYSKNGFEKFENLNKIPQYIIDQTQYILDKQKETHELSTVMAPPEPLHSTTMRQLTSKINLFWSRDHYINELFSPETVQEMQKIYIIYKNQIPSITCEEFDSIRQKYNVNWIIINSDNLEIIQYLNQTNCIDVKEIDNYMIYQY